MDNDDLTQPGCILVIDGPESPLLEEVASDLGIPVRYAPIVPCSVCEYFECVCIIKKQHQADCLFLLARMTLFDIQCDQHKDALCPECYACTCQKGKEVE